MTRRTLRPSAESRYGARRGTRRHADKRGDLDDRDGLFAAKPGKTQQELALRAVVRTLAA